jgi:hypothetical protein
MKNSRTNIEEFKNRKMNDSTYKLRRSVMNHLYEAREIVGRENWKRVDVRIADARGDHNFIGMARLNDFIIWIDAKYADNDPYLRELVYHELVHAMTGFGHDENCRLMSPTINCQKPMTKKQSDKLLKKYF